MLRTKFGEFNAKEFIYSIYIYILENVLTIIGKRWNKIFSLFLKFDLPLSQVESSSAPILPIRFFVHPIYIYILPFFQSVSDIHARVRAHTHTRTGETCTCTEESGSSRMYIGQRRQL